MFCAKQQNFTLSFLPWEEFILAVRAIFYHSCPQDTFCSSAPDFFLWCPLFPPGNTDGRTASNVANVEQIRHGSITVSHLSQVPLWSLVWFVCLFVCFLNYFLPFGIFLALKDLLFHYMYGWHLVKQAVLCYSRDRNNFKWQVTWNNKKWADAGKLPQ